MTAAGKIRLLHSTCPLLVAVAILAGCRCQPAAASTATVHDLRPISGASEFAGPCPGFPFSTRDAEGEPMLALDPHNPNHLVAVWTQDVFTQPAGAASLDGGRTFSHFSLPGASTCSGGTDPFALDPWASFGPDGFAYLTLGAGDPVTLPSLEPATRVLAYGSADAGRSWHGPTVVEPKDGSFYDKPTVTADPARAGTAYVAYTRRTGPQSDSTGVSYVRGTSNRGTGYGSRSAMYDPGPNQFPGAVVSVALSDGTLVGVFILARLNQPPLQMSQRSTDGGRTWSPPVLIGEAATTPIQDPDSREPVQADPLPTVVALGHNVYVAWHHATPASSQIRFSKSLDGARSWQPPRDAIDVAAQAFLPTIAVAREGTLGLTWYDTRNDRQGDGRFTADYWFAHSHDAGATWEQVHVGGPFDLRTAANLVSSHFIGDYFGLVAVPDGFLTAFTMARPQARIGPSDIFFARIALPHPPAHPPAAGLLRMRFMVIPRSVPAGRRARLRFTVSASGRAVAGVRIAFRGRVRRSDGRGHATILISLRRAGRYRARATLAGYVSASATIRALS